MSPIWIFWQPCCRNLSTLMVLHFSNYLHRIPRHLKHRYRSKNHICKLVRGKVMLLFHKLRGNWPPSWILDSWVLYYLSEVSGYVFIHFVVSENHIIDTKILILGALRKKLAKPVQPWRPSWIFEKIHISSSRREVDFLLCSLWRSKLNVSKEFALLQFCSRYVCAIC